MPAKQSKRFEIEQNAPKYPIDLSKEAKVEMKVSPAEMQQKNKALKLNVDDIKRLWLDLRSMGDLSFEDIASLEEKSKHIYPNVKDFYYWKREERINKYYERFAQWFKLRKELGILHDNLE